MAQYDAVAIISKETIVDEFYTLVDDDATLTSLCNPGGIHKRIFPKDPPLTKVQAGRDSWVWFRVLLNPDRGIPVSWDKQAKCHILVEAQTQRVSIDDNPGRRLEVVHSRILEVVADQKPHASMVLPFALTEGPTTFEFAESTDRVFSEAIYQTVIN